MPLHLCLEKQLVAGLGCKNLLKLRAVQTLCCGPRFSFTNSRFVKFAWQGLLARKSCQYFCLFWSSASLSCYERNCCFWLPNRSYPILALRILCCSFACLHNDSWTSWFFQLLHNKANINAVNEHGNTPLHYACFWNYDQISEVSVSASFLLHENCLITSWSHFIAGSCQ